jgi:hypothetical protein
MCQSSCLNRTNSSYPTEKNILTKHLLLQLDLNINQNSLRDYLNLRKAEERMEYLFMPLTIKKESKGTITTVGTIPTEI